MLISKKQARILKVILVMSLVISGVLIIITNFRENLVFYYTPSELIEKPPKPSQKIRIGGIVKDHSFKSSGLDIEFIVTDFVKEFTVKYHGVLPGLFREGQGVVANGIFNQKIFIADEILTKHDEKYMPKEVVKALKQSGKWKEK